MAAARAELYSGKLSNQNRACTVGWERYLQRANFLSHTRVMADLLI
eukprot:COSAG01_NODE_1184_length_11346_cov_58.600249_11_plen_46_part_00